MADKRKTALITGAGQNIGRACALAMADAGFNVVINGRRKQEPCEKVAKEVQSRGVDALVVMGDVGSGAACQALAEAAHLESSARRRAHSQRSDRPEKPFLEMDEAEWHEVLNVNMNASFWLARACLPGMVEVRLGPHHQFRRHECDARLQWPRPRLDLETRQLGPDQSAREGVRSEGHYR